MEWTIIGRDMQALCRASTVAPKAISIFDDKHLDIITNNVWVSSYDFSINQQHANSKYFTEGNYIAFKDRHNRTRIFTLMSHDGNHQVRTWHAEEVGLGLINVTADKWDYSNEPHTIAWYLDNLVLKNTGWEIGVNEISSLTRSLKFEGQSGTQLTRLGDVANQFDGAEVAFEVEMTGSRITKQTVNIYKKIGHGQVADRYIDNVDLLSLQTSGSIEDLRTSMIGYGSQPDVKDGENTEDVPPIDFADLSYDDGQFFSPKGDKAVYDRVNGQLWRTFRGYNYTGISTTDGYLGGVYTYDTKDPNELLTRTISHLKEVNTLSEIYEANLLHIDANIGEYVQIAHHGYNPPIYLQARVEQITYCYSAKGKDTAILGDYTKLESHVDPRIKDMIDQLANQIKPNYTWIRYAKDDKGTGMTATPTPDTKYVAIVSNKSTGVPSDDPSDYAGHWQLIKGSDGKDGIPGATGADGKTSYTHFAYADNVSGTKDFSTDNPTGRSYMGVYSNFTKADSNNPSDYVWSYTKGETGPEGTQGIPGKPGIDGKTPYTHVAYADNDEGGGFSQSPDNKAYMGWYSDFTQADSNDPSLYGWSLIKGADGKDGADGVAGKDGVGVKTTTITYAQSTSGTTPPTASWTASVPTLIKGQYLWTKTVWTYTDSTTETGYTVSYNAKDGNTGSDGRAGKDGVGIKSTLIEYVGAVSGTSNPTSGWSTTIPTVPAGQYLWTRTTWKYTDGTSEQGFTNALMGRTGVAGKDGVGIKSTQIMYTQSTSGTTAPITGWTAQVPTLIKGQYLWTQTTWLYTDNTGEAGYTVSYNAKDGNTGANGIAGKDGVGIKSTAITYATSASGTSAPTSGWVSTPPSATAGQFIWTRTIWTYTDNTTETGYSVGKIGEKGATGSTGANGAPGKPGADGRTPYFHQAWADSKDGKTNFSATDPANRGYLGTYTDYTQADSTDPSKYFWVELVGALGIGTPNLIYNAGFKGSGDSAGSDGWTTPPGGWVSRPSTRTGYSGSNGLVINVNQISDSWQVISARRVAVQDYNQPYSFAARVSLFNESTGIDRLYCELGMYDNDNKWLGGRQTNWLDLSKKDTYQLLMSEDAGLIEGTAFIQFRLAVHANASGRVYACISQPILNASDRVAPFSDNQATGADITQINNALSNVNGKIDAVTKVDSQATAPTNPKKGDQWWVKDANGEINAFKIWDGTQWAPSTITQSLLVIKELDAVNINGSVINGSKFTNAFTFKSTLDVTYTGVTTIADGAVKITYKIPSTNEIGTTQITAEGYKQELFNSAGSRTGLSMLSPNSLQLETNGVGGFLTPDDLVRIGPESWSNSDAGGTYTIAFERRWGRVWVTGELLIPTSSFGNYHTVFTIKTPGLRPKKNRWFVGMRTGNVPVAGEIEMRPNGEFVAIGVPQGGRYTFEGVSYSLGDE